MSLVKLLSIGQSFAGAKHVPGRYKMCAEFRLPQFGSGGLNDERVRRQSNCGGSLSEAKFSFLERALRMLWAGDLERASGEGRQNASVDAFAKAHPVGRLSEAAFPGKARRPLLTRLLVRKGSSSIERPLVQSELALENVRVVRNDLSDADLEVVAPKRSTQARSARPTERNEMDAPRPAESGLTWNRLAARLFVAGRARLE